MSSPTLTEGDVSVADKIVALEHEYVLQNYARYPIAFDRGKGCYLYDFEGKKYLDFISGIGVNALGHGHPRIVKVIREQAARLIHCSNLYYHEYQGKLAKTLAEASGLERSFFCNSGTEAMEGALKMVRAYGNRKAAGKHEIISLDNSFHGRTLGALSITGQPKYRKDFEPLLSGIHFASPNDATALEQLFSERTAGVVIEVIQGEGGVYPVAQPYLQKARELCNRYDALLVFDEIQCGVGRPGTYFAYQLFDPPIMPDVTLTAKPFACGLPLGVVICNERAAASIGSGMHGTTFGGGPLACRVALEFFDILEELLPRIREVGGYFREKLEQLARKHGFIKEVRGQGLMLGLEMEYPCKQVVLDAMKEGLLINSTHDVVLRFLPPYIIGEREVDKAVRVLARIFKAWRPAVSASSDAPPVATGPHS